MSGAIMPEPLAMPAIRTVRPPIFAVAEAPLGKVSVVMMAPAARSQLPDASARASPGSFWTIVLSAGRGSPITPVEETNTSRSAHPSAAAAAAIVCSTAVLPTRPVKALALPEFTTMARARPPGSASRHQSTGADAVSERVSAPAIAVPGASSTSSRSSRPL